MSELRGRILIVDPDAAAAQDLAQPIEARGNQVVVARSGDDGLRRFWEVLPDLVFVDILALGDGAERMCRELKRTDYGVITPIVVHSPRHPTLSRVEVMRAYGAVDYVVKPGQQGKVQALLDWVLAIKDEPLQPVPAAGGNPLDRFSLSSDSEGVVSLESGSLPYLLGRAEEEKLSGLLLMISGGYKNFLLLEQGLIVGASSNAAAEQTERILLSMRKLTPAQLAEVKSKPHSGPDPFPLLSFLGILRSDEHKEVLRYQALTIGVSMFRVMTGMLQFRRGESVDCPRLDGGIRPTTLALIGLRKNPALLRTATERFVRDPVVFMVPSAGARQASRTLPLTKFERTVLASVDGERSVKELRELGRLAQIDLDEPLAVLVGSGILKPSASQPAGKVRSPAETASPPPTSLPQSGNLEKRPFIEVVGTLLREGATGMLVVEAAASRSFAFLDHEIVYARSSRPEDALGRLLVAERVISREALDRALSLQRQLPERRLGSLLVEMHELTPDSLYGGLRSQILRILEDTFSWHFGKFSFLPSERPPEWTVRLDSDPVALLRNGAARLSHKQLKGRWSRAEAYLVASDTGRDTSLLTGPERELLTQAYKEGGVALGSSDVGVLRRAILLVVSGFAQVVGDADPEGALGMADDDRALEREPGAMATPTPTPTPTPPPLATERHERHAERSDGELSFHIVSHGHPASPADPAADAASVTIAFLREELVADKRALDARLRKAEAELRQAMEELGRLRERTRHLESENQALRLQRPATTPDPVAPAPGAAPAVAPVTAAPPAAAASAPEDPVSPPLAARVSAAAAELPASAAGDAEADRAAALPAPAQPARPARARTKTPAPARRKRAAKVARVPGEAPPQPPEPGPPAIEETAAGSSEPADGPWRRVN